jgi:hypothetical protein
MLPKKFAIVASTLIIVLSLFLQHSVDAQNTKSNQNNSGFIVSEICMFCNVSSPKINIIITNKKRPLQK